MRIKTISRVESQHTRKDTGDVIKVSRNVSSEAHRFERAREYQRAVVATKLDKMFAKPFVGALDGHRDGVWCTASCRRSLVEFLSGACDGEVKAWDLAQRRCVWTLAAHTGFVRGLSMSPHADKFLSCGDDNAVKLWSLRQGGSADGDTNRHDGIVNDATPHFVWRGPRPILSVDHHWARQQFCSTSEGVDVWDYERSTPVSSFVWGHDDVSSARCMNAY